MTQPQAISQDSDSPVGRFIALLYGLAAYAAFFVTILYAIGFVSGLAVQKATIDTGTVVPIAEALIVNLLLMSVFAVQHSDGAQAVQAVVDAIRAEIIERSTYVLFSVSRSCCCSGNGVRCLPWSGIDNPGRLGGDRVVVGRLADCVHQHVPDQPFRAVWSASGRQQSHRPPDAGASFRTAFYYKFCGTRSSQLHHRVLGRADMTVGALLFADSDHGVHLRRHPVGRARPDRALWR